jgi:16S rRNA (uracil1498-N3)-methyltransferase
MARRRFFVDAIRGGTAELRGDDARHLTRVLRVQPGQLYEVTDSRSAYLAEISEARGDSVLFRVLEPVASPEAPVAIALLAALIKFDRFEWIIEKATELGVERILPVETARSEKGLLGASIKRAGRWARIAKESSQQSRRLRAPEILPAVRLEAALPIPVAHRFILDEGAAPPLVRVLPTPAARSNTVALIAGPEGGWTEAERDEATRAGWQPASLGPYILRTETAAAAAIAIVVSAWCS